MLYLAVYMYLVQLDLQKTHLYAVSEPAGMTYFTSCFE